MADPYTILFVEDDRTVRESTAEILTAKGFRMLVAQDGYEALRLLAENDVHVLFTDVVMAGLDGIELARKSKLLKPDLKIMFMTGYYSRAGDATRLGMGKLLFKPLRGEEIDIELRELLAAEQDP